MRSCIRSEFRALGAAPAATPLGLENFAYCTSARIMAAATPGGPVRGSAPQFKGSRELVRWSDELVRGSSECTKMEKFWVMEVM